MNTPDERPRALRSAETAAAAWTETVEHQQDATPRHADFYALAGEIVATLYALDDLSVVLAHQVGGYGEGRALRRHPHRRSGRPPRRGRGMPARRACGLGPAAAANDFWSAIGHIGVEATP